MTSILPTTLTADEAAAQSLASGTAGEALLAIEYAATGRGDWNTAQRLTRKATAVPIDAAAHSSLYYGAPAIAFLLHIASTDGQQRYVTEKDVLDRHVRQLTRARLHVAHERLRAGVAASFTEYDLFSGLVGLGALLLHQRPATGELNEVLQYVVRLTEPRRIDGLVVPGWWVDHHPDPILPTPGGHANNGMAHGAAGLLALLAHAWHRNVRVAGQDDAIGRLCAWFDRWQQHSPTGPWWPQWLTQEQLRTGRPGPGPSRPSWCYGTPGIARAQQLAALATHDPTRQQAAEAAIAACLTEPQLDRLTDAGICHGLAGLYQTAYRAALDSHDHAIADRLLGLTARLLTPASPDSAAFLTGRTGADLARETIRTGRPPQTRWDACLLIA
jgi:lantibiotic biosynthesis protein